MENPTRTAEHLDRIKQRHNDLSNELAGLMQPKSVIVWEVGSGHGHFLAAYAAAHPKKVCVGVDITRDRIERGLRKRNRAKLDNLHFIHAEANDFLRALPPGVTFSSIFILFPDPWPKRRHHKNRILQPDFLTAVAARAGEGARLHFRTDYEPYFRDASQVIAAHADWKLVDEPWPFEQQTVFQSRAEQHHSLTARRRSPGA
jgi:tRNA (guanine-N7-)-methyltransferase